MSVNARDIKVLILFSFLLAKTSILSCFLFLFLVILSNFLIIPVAKEKIEVKIALAIPTEYPITVSREIINTPPLLADKKNKSLSMWSNVAAYLLNF